jgi:aminoglycoside phosphotransferase (APT) family kinase protein
MEGIDAAAVTAWFERNVPGMQPPLRFDLVSGGKSNLTFGAHDAAGHAYVVRRPPLGHVLATAHDMSREYRIISALWGKGVPVARTYGLCQDASVNGADFYVMDFVDGVVLHDADAARTVADADRRALGEDIIDVLAELHVLDPNSGARRPTSSGS